MMPRVDSQQLIFFAVLVIVAALSLLPLSLKNAIGTTGTFHYIGHITLFAILSFLLTRNIRGLKHTSVLIAMCLLLGVTLEYLQVALYGGDFEPYDVRNDAIGISLGVLPRLIGYFASRAR